MENLKKHGVQSASVDFGNFDPKSSSVQIVVDLHVSENDKNGDKVRKIKFNQHVDTSALDYAAQILEGYCHATKEELSLLDTALEEYELEDLEPELYNFMAQEYALGALPNEYAGGDWTEQDENFYAGKANLKSGNGVE